MDPALVWFLAGVVLALLEFAAPGLILIFFGAGAWLVALTTWFALTTSLPSQMRVFAASSALLIAGLRKWIRGKFSGFVTDVHDLSTNLDEFTGKSVEVRQDVDPGSSTGRVEFKGSTWSARSHEPIRKGESAVIESVDGIVLVIKKSTEGSS